LKDTLPAVKAAHIRKQPDWKPGLAAKLPSKCYPKQITPTCLDSATWRRFPISPGKLGVACFKAMKMLETEFTRAGWNHQQITRHENTAIYKRWKDGGLDPHYEVIKIKAHKGFKVPGTEIITEPAEYYPSDSSWGTDGFTCHTFAEASEKFTELLSRKPTKQA
jgi:hypothetical protein